MAKEITICGKKVKMIYCAATENSFEDLSGKSIEVFIPKTETDDKGNVIIVEPAKAHIGDFVTLGIAGIISYYVKNKQEVPITTEDILYEATPAERNELIAAIVGLRIEWYAIPRVVSDELKEEYESLDDKERKSSKNQ